MGRLKWEGDIKKQNPERVFHSGRKPVQLHHDYRHPIIASQGYLRSLPVLRLLANFPTKLDDG
jgi:hypothetical protein